MNRRIVLLLQKMALRDNWMRISSRDFPANHHFKMFVDSCLNFDCRFFVLRDSMSVPSCFVKNQDRILAELRYVFGAKNTLFSHSSFLVVARKTKLIA